MNRRTALCIACATAALAGCDGSSNGGQQTGIFSDSPVAGVRYETPTHSGLTDVSGRFHYRSGETVSFSLGGIELGEAPAGPKVTPLDLVGASSIDEAATLGVKDRLINTLLLLQSLDRDQNPDNGLDLGELDQALDSESLDLSLPLDEIYDGGLRRIINQHEGFFQTPREAQNHFMEAQDLTIAVEYPSVDLLDDDGDGEVDRRIRYLYNGTGGLSTVTETNEQTGQTRRTVTLTYDANGYPARADHVNLVPSLQDYTNLFEYDANGRLLTVSQVNSDGEVRVQLRNTYDTAGKIAHSYSELPGYNTFGQLPLDYHIRFTPPQPDPQLTSAANFGGGVPGLPFADTWYVPDAPLALFGGGLIGVPPWNTITDTGYFYGEQGELIETIVDRRYIEVRETEFPIPQDSRTVNTYAGNFLINRKTNYEGGSTTIHEDSFEYSPDASIARCERRRNDEVTVVHTFDPVPGEMVTSSGSCLYLTVWSLTRNDDGQVIRSEEEDIRPDGGQPAPYITRRISEYDYEQGRVSERRFDLSADGTVDFIYRYQYTDSGLLKFREILQQNGSRLVRTREFITLTLDAVP